MVRFILLILLLALLAFVVSCTKSPAPEDNSLTGASIKELQETACDAADKAGTCLTRLPELGFITPEECCAQFGRCCS